jgi:hypothetical protein
MKTLFAAILLSMVAFCNVAVAQSSNVDADIESLRADTRADKVAIIGDVMKFNDHDSKICWPIYRKYEAELMKVNDGRVALIKQYADKYDTMTDADARSMIAQSLDFESQRTEAKRKVARELQKAGLSSIKVAKFIQLEHRLDLVIDTQLAYQIPAVADKPGTN